MSIPDSWINAELTFGGTSLEEYFLIEPEVFIGDAKGALLIEDIENGEGRIVEGEYHHAIIDFLRRNGAREYRSRQEYDDLHRIGPK